MNEKSLYARDGVDVSAEAKFSAYAGAVCRESYKNSPFIKILDVSEGQFRGPRPFIFQNLPEGHTIEATTDSIGTKGVITDAARTYELSAYDLIAMVSSDITRFGGIPLVCINILDVVGVGDEGGEQNRAYRALIDGLGKVAKELNIVILKGETAQISVCLGSEIVDSPTKFNWGSTMVGAYHPVKMVTGNTVALGQVVIALREYGFRCNGISSVRKALSMQYGEEWWDNSKAKNDIQAAAAPSKLYDMYINTLHGWYAKNFKPEVELHAIVHLSGGGIKEKFANDLVLARGLSATLDNLWPLPEIMEKCAQWRGMSDEELYEAWNSGQGMLLVVDKNDATHCVERAKDFGIEAQVCGQIEKKDSPVVRIHSKLSDTIVIKYR